MSPVDPLFDQLRALPTRALDPRAEDRVRRRTRAMMREAGPRGPWKLLVALWSRGLMPALVTATVATYLVWAFQSAGALYR